MRESCSHGCSTRPVSSRRNFGVKLEGGSAPGYLEEVDRVAEGHQARMIMRSFISLSAVQSLISLVHLLIFCKLGRGRTSSTAVRFCATRMGRSISVVFIIWAGRGLSCQLIVGDHFWGIIAQRHILVTVICNIMQVDDVQAAPAKGSQINGEIFVWSSKGRPKWQRNCRTTTHPSSSTSFWRRGRGSSTPRARIRRRSTSSPSSDSWPVTTPNPLPTPRRPRSCSGGEGISGFLRERLTWSNRVKREPMTDTHQVVDCLRLENRSGRISFFEGDSTS